MLFSFNDEQCCFSLFYIYAMGKTHFLSPVVETFILGQLI